MKIELKNPTSILGDAEKKIIYEAVDMLKAGNLPAKDMESEIIAFSTKVLEIKSNIANLIMEVQYTRSFMLGDLTHAKKDAMYEFEDAYTKSEAKEWACLDPKYDDKRKQYEALLAIKSYLESIQWDLVHALKYCE